MPVSPADDGAQPKGTLTLAVVNGAPVLYGRTAAGGNATTCGTIFRMSVSPPVNYTVLYRFSGSAGCSPRHDAMLANAQGALYSTTKGLNNDGRTRYNAGNILTVSPGAGTVSIVHRFAGAPADGSDQHSSFSFDSSGNVFGMTAAGGTNDKGFLYYLASGSRTPIGLHNFSKSTGDDPHGRIVLLGNTLWGITRKGRSSDLGVVFSLPVPATLPTASTDLPITVVHEFAGYGHDGAFSDHGYLTPVTQNGSTVLYGMTQCGGTGDGSDRKYCKGKGDGDGVVFQIDPTTQREATTRSMNLPVRITAMAQIRTDRCTTTQPRMRCTEPPATAAKTTTARFSKSFRAPSAAQAASLGGITSPARTATAPTRSTM